MLYRYKMAAINVNHAIFHGTPVVLLEIKLEIPLRLNKLSIVMSKTII